MSNHKCLIVEDEAPIRELLALLLVREGYQVQTVGASDQALRLLNTDEFNLMIVDWMLPVMSGIELIEKVRLSKPSLPILMLTAKTQPEDIVTGLQAGADDYITKPFDAAILKARVKALLRRSQALSQAENEQSEYTLGEIHINTLAHEVFINKEQVHLTPSEYKILLEMLQNVGKVLTREYLMSKVQGEGIIVTGRTIDTHVFALRKKMGPQSEHIETIRGVGYRIKNLA